MSKYKNDFDGIAPLYDGLAFLVFGHTIFRAQQALISYIPPQSTILFIGGGTGKILPEILQRNPRRICYVEKSEKMLQRARQRISPADMAALDWILGDENHRVVVQGQFDVVITFFLLDLFDEPSLHRLVRTLNQSLKPGGQWLVADFNSQAGGFTAQWLIRIMYCFFRLVSRVQARRMGNFPAVFRQLYLCEIQQKS